MNNKQILGKFFMILLMIGVVTTFLTQLFYFFFGQFWVSITFAVALQIVLSYAVRQIGYERKVRRSLENYDKLEFRKYPAVGIHCAACKKPNDFLLDWNTVGFKCKHCNIENGLEIQLNPFISAVESETTTVK
jgi:uncharacterized membrane protein